MKLSEWILLPHEVRMSGIDLTAPCVIIKKRQWTYRMNRMLEWLGIENDVPNLIKAKIHRIHRCENHSMGPNGICCNPLHWYIGTMSENVMSLSPEKRRAGGRACAGREMTWSDKIKKARKENGTDRGYSSSAKGRTISAESKEKISESLKQYYAREKCRSMSLSDPQMPDFED
jgi:hypothetical protein